MSKIAAAGENPLTEPAPARAGMFVRGAQVFLPCLLFAVVSWLYQTPLIVVVPMLLFFIAFLVWEIRRPLISPQMQSWDRWPANGVLWAVNIAVCSRMGVPIVLLAAGYGFKYGQGWLTHTFESPVLITLLTIVILDGWHYALHRLMHRWGWLWRMHRVHHSDRDFDLTTGLRFHPLEAAITVVWMFIPMILLGMPYYALLANAAFTLVVDYFTHANVQLPPTIEHWARKIFVTPSLHRIHHSLLASEDRHNYSTAFSFWDRIFGTYQDKSAQNGPAPLTGVAEIPVERSRGVIHILLLPFLR